MEINDLPNEMLIEIVGHLLSFKNISLVNRRFYHIACAVVNKNINLSLNKHVLENMPRLHSIQDTGRKISKVTINFDEMTKNEVAIVISIISKFSESIKYLKISGEVCELAFRAILSLAPNVEQLILIQVRLSKSRQYNNSDRAVLNLRCLNTLKLLQCDDALQDLLFRLPPGVLTELQLNRGFNLHDLIENGVFERQRTIKNFTMFVSPDDHSHVTADFLDNLQLQSFAYEGKKIENIETALSRQTTLKSLVWHWNVCHNLMTVALKHLTELETLSVSLHLMKVEDFVNIQKLRKLKHLFLDQIQPETINAFTRLDNSRITCMLIGRNSRLVSRNAISALAKSAPNLRQLTFLATDKWSGVLKSFNFVERLMVGAYGACDNQYFNQSLSVNPKLTQLVIFYKISFGTRLLKKIIADYPNLKNLILHSESFCSSLEFRLIVEGFQKLESLSMQNAQELTLDDFHYLRDRKRNLKFVCFPYVNPNIIDNHMTDIESILNVFNVVNVSEHEHLNIYDDYRFCPPTFLCSELLAFP